MRHVYLFVSEHLKNRLIQLIGGKSVGVRALIANSANEILLVRHTYREGLHTPGGGVKRGESALAAIRREVYEEVGLEIEVSPSIFAVYKSVWRGIDDYVILYVIRNFGGLPLANHKDEIVEVTWVSRDTIPLDVTPRTLARLREYWGEAAISETWY
ncbi:NUDIX domain-containing protein [Mesorhizobium sp.]|uniref:NUDIX domain-containing protein n=1 Tax=Mesorhizobium sp. TaxID=1871066 RepID=UPI000FE4FD2A|nr:NUDIX domain-containing protein [Mesorhizobium sp.]RWE56388.1 MAG: NUDIX domain-containing protein [Mesorhizobium sp.]